MGLGLQCVEKRNGQMERMFACLKRGVLVFRAAHTSTNRRWICYNGSSVTASERENDAIPVLVTLYVYLYPNLERS